MILWNILQQNRLWDMYSMYLYIDLRSKDTLKGVQRPHAVSTQWGHMDVCITVWTQGVHQTHVDIICHTQNDKYRNINYIGIKRYIVFNPWTYYDI